MDNMEKMIEALRELQKNALNMYAYSHAAHWNVEGILFVQLHGFFKDVYEDVHGSLDPISENIRKSGAYATFPQIVSVGTETSPIALLLHLEYLNNLCIDSTRVLFAESNALGEQAIANFAAERMDKHQFWAWWIKASLASSTL